jgi:hypothetical protein
MSQKADKQVGSSTNNWLNLRAGENASNTTDVRGVASRKGADFSHNNTTVDALDAVDSELDPAARESAVVRKDPVAISSDKGTKPEHSNFRAAPAITPEINASESDITTTDLKKLNISSAVNTNSNSIPKPETGLKKEIEINSGFVTSQGPRHEKAQATSDSEQSLEFEEIQVKKDNKVSSAPPTVLQTTRTTNEVVPQSQYVNSIGPAKPLTQQVNLTGSVPVAEVAGLDAVGSSSDSNTTLDTLTQT